MNKLHNTVQALYTHLVQISKSIRKKEEKDFVKDNIVFVEDIAHILGVELPEVKGKLKYTQKNIQLIGDQIATLGDDIRSLASYSDTEVKEMCHKAERIQADDLILFEPNLSRAHDYRYNSGTTWDYDGEYVFS